MASWYSFGKWGVTICPFQVVGNQVLAVMADFRLLVSKPQSRDELLIRNEGLTRNSQAMRCVTVGMMISRAILNGVTALACRLDEWLRCREVSGRQSGSSNRVQPCYRTIEASSIKIVKRRGSVVVHRKIIPGWDGSPGQMAHRAE